MKYLNGRDLADFVKERQAKDVRALRQAHGIFPRLAIVMTSDNPVIATYVRLKQRYGEDILVSVSVHKVVQSEVLSEIARLNADTSVHGIIVQLPLENPAQTSEVVNAVASEKDVDGLGERAVFDPATPIAINWLLAGYNISLTGAKIAIVGQGRLVGAPLLRMWRNSGYDVTPFDQENSDNLLNSLRAYDVIVTATGVAGLITNTMLKPGAVVVDAGTAAEHGKVVGDLAPDVRLRDDLAITPEKGGVGPLTISALFDNVLRAARQKAEN